MGLREVRTMTHPICRAIWSNRFCTSARVIGSSVAISAIQCDAVVARRINCKTIARADQERRGLLVYDRGSGERVARSQRSARVNWGFAPAALLVDPDRATLVELRCRG